MRGTAVKRWSPFKLMALKLSLSLRHPQVAASVLQPAFPFRNELFKGPFDAVC